jgi:hypothetical protein
MVKVMPGLSSSSVLVEVAADAVAAEFAHHRKAVLLGELLDRPADVAQVDAGFHPGDAVPHGVIGQRHQPLGGDRDLADHEHAAGVAVPAVLDHGDVDVDDVALFQRLFVGDAVAHHVVDRSAQRGRVGRVARRLVAQRGRDRALVLHAFRRQPVDLPGRDARLDVRGQVIQHFGRETAGRSHALDAGLVFVGNAHRFNYPRAGRAAGAATQEPLPVP